MPKQQAASLPIKAQSTWVYHPEAGVYSWSGVIQHTIQLGIADLATEGYAPVKLESPTQLAALHGQLARVMTVGGSDSLQVWALRSALDQVDRFPVVLAFRMPAPPEGDTTVTVLQALPPPHIGECALVWHRSSWQLLTLDQIGSEGTTLYPRLRTAVADMAAPASEWWTEADARGTLREGQDAANLQAHLAELVDQRKRQKSGPARWEAQWQTLRLLAGQLAEQYWIASQSTTRTAIVNTAASAISLPADAMTQLIMRGLLSGQEYAPDDVKGTAIWHPPFGSDQNVTIELPSQEGETWTQMMVILAQLGDEAQDVFCAVLAMALATNGSAALAQPFYLSPEDILAFLGRQESNRAYTAEQRSATIHLLNVLTRIHVSATLPSKRRRNRVLRLNSPIVDLHGSTIGEYTTDTGEVVWQKRQVSLGNWAAIAPQLSSRTVLMLRKVLSYHPQKGRFPKRLGRFLTLQLAADEVMEISMGQLIKQAGIPVDRNNAIRTRQVIERALEELVKDGILGEAVLIVDATDLGQERQRRIDVCTRGWWDDYEQQSWRLSPPTDIAGALSAAKGEE